MLTDALEQGRVPRVGCEAVVLDGEAARPPRRRVAEREHDDVDGEHRAGGEGREVVRPGVGEVDDLVAQPGETGPGGDGLVVEQRREVAAVGLAGHEGLRTDRHPLRPAPPHQVLRVVLEGAHPAGVVVQQVARLVGAVGQAGAHGVGPLHDRDVEAGAEGCGLAQQRGRGHHAGGTATDDEHRGRLVGHAAPSDGT